MKKISKSVFLIGLIMLMLLLVACRSYRHESDRNDTENYDTATSGQNTETFSAENEPTLFWQLAYVLDTSLSQRPYDSSIEYSDDVLNTYIRLPKAYEKNFDGIVYKIEFYEEVVPMHSYIISRITVTNTTDSDIIYQASTSSPGIFVKNGDELLTMTKSTWMNWVVDRSWIKLICAGDTFTFESAHFVQSEFFQYGCEYRYESGFGTEASNEFYEVSFDIEVCVRETDKESDSLNEQGTIQGTTKNPYNGKWYMSE